MDNILDKLKHQLFYKEIRRDKTCQEFWLSVEWCRVLYVKWTSVGYPHSRG